MNKRAHVFFSGKVQGVYFRSKTKDKAKELGLSGWVKNLNDGRVEAVFEGEDKNVEKMIQWGWKGPEYAVVGDVEVKYETYNGEFNDFSVRN